MSKYLERSTMTNKTDIINNAIDNNESFIELSGQTFELGHYFASKTIISNCFLFFNEDLNILTCLNKNELEKYKTELEYLLCLTNNRLNEVNNPIEKIDILIEENTRESKNHIDIIVKKYITYSDNYGDENIYSTILENINLLKSNENQTEIDIIINNLKEKYNIS